MLNIFLRCLSICVLVLMGGCNLFSGLDDAESKSELLSEAQALMDENKCDDAVKKLQDFAPKDDDVRQLLGWAQLCKAGASLTKVGKSLLNYNSSSNNLTVVGTLANNMVPYSDAKLTSINDAIANFTAMTQADQRAFNAAFAYIIKAAVVVAKSSADGAKVVRGDVSAGGCVGANCSTGTGCTAVNMNDTDANSVGDSLIKASTEAGLSTGLGAAGDLASRLGSSASAVTANINRCTVVNSILEK